MREEEKKLFEPFLEQFFIGFDFSEKNIFFDKEVKQSFALNSHAIPQLEHYKLADRKERKQLNKKNGKFLKSIKSSKFLWKDVLFAENTSRNTFDA